MPPGKQQQETTGEARESIQIPENCADLCWLFQTHDSYLPAELLSGEQSWHQHLRSSHFFLCCRTSSSGKSAGSHSPPSRFVTLKRWAEPEEQHIKIALVQACSCPVPATSQASSGIPVPPPALAAAAVCPSTTDFLGDVCVTSSHD